MGGVGALRAVDLIKLQWGYMLKHPNGTQSTFWEGYVSPSLLLCCVSHESCCNLHIKWPFFQQKIVIFRGNSPIFLRFQ